MKRLLFLIAALIVSVSMEAQTDVISVKDAIQVFKNKTLAAGKKVLEKQGYTYKGVSSDQFGKDYNWVRNMDLSKDFLPTALGKGNSSLFMLAVDSRTIYLYVFNRSAFEGLKAQAKRLGYDMGKALKTSEGTIICTKDEQPTLTFMELQQPLPYCMQITE